MESAVADSRAVSRILRDELHPYLKNIGFTKFKGGRAYRYDEGCVLGFTTAAVGNYFSQVTGYPTASFTATAWAHYDCIPSFEQRPMNPKSAFLPKNSHFAIDLGVVSPAIKSIRKCRSEPEQERNDIWWVEPDGSNLAEIAQDLKAAVVAQATPWWDAMLDAANALNVAAEMPSSPHRSFLMYFLAKSLNRADIEIENEELVKNQRQPGVMRAV